MAAIGLGAFGIALSAGPTAAQRAVTPFASLSLAEHRVDVGYGVERSRGAILGGGARVRLGARVELALRVQGGWLNAATPGAVDRDVGEVGLEAGVRAAPWLTFRAGAQRRAYSSMIARQGWTLVDVGAEVRFAFARGTITGVTRAAVVPVVSVSGLPRPDVAVTAATGLQIRRRGATLGALYSLERYDFPAQGAISRREQLAAVTLRLDVGLGRR